LTICLNYSASRAPAWTPLEIVGAKTTFPETDFIASFSYCIFFRNKTEKYRRQHAQFSSVCYKLSSRWTLLQPPPQKKNLGFAQILWPCLSCRRWRACPPVKPRGYATGPRAWFLGHFSSSLTVLPNLLCHLYGVQQKQYTDHTQLCIALLPSDPRMYSLLFKPVLRRCKHTDGMTLNTDKSSAILLGTAHSDSILIPKIVLISLLTQQPSIC